MGAMQRVQVAGITKGSVVDGLGIRTVVYLQGCPRHCPGCHNPETIPTQGGRELTVAQLVKEITATITPLTKGVTFSGGDPLLQADALLAVLQRLRQHHPRLDIWVYTGYTWGEISQLPALTLVDVLVEGPYLVEHRDITLAFRGSSNQRIIDVVKTLATGGIVLLALETE